MMRTERMRGKGRDSVTVCAAVGKLYGVEGGLFGADLLLSC